MDEFFGAKINFKQVSKSSNDGLKQFLMEHQKDTNGELRKFFIESKNIPNNKPNLFFNKIDKIDILNNKTNIFSNKINKIDILNNKPNIFSNKINKVDILNNKPNLFSNKINKMDILNNKPNLFSNKIYKMDILNNKPNLFSNKIYKIDILNNKPKLLNNTMDILNNKPKLLNNTMDILNNKPKLFNNTADILNNKPKLLNNKSNIFNNKSNIFNNKSNIVNNKIEIDISNLNSIFENKKNLNFNINTDSVYVGIDWLYTSVESLYAFDFKIVYFWLLNSIYDESIDFFFLSIWFLTLNIGGLQLFWSVILDNYIINTLFNFSLTDDWFRGFLSNKDSALFVIHHPELLLIKNQILNNFFFNFLTDSNITLIQYLETQSLLTPIMLFPQLLFVGYLTFFFVSFYFSFYTNYTKEESTIDADYLTASITVESEKEIGSIDDMLMPSIIFIYTFGWYFYLHCWSILCSMPEFVLVIFFFPLLYYTIANIPSFLLNDFGILYYCYLRGVAPSPSLVFELMYDYIAVIAFYVRILTQGVRLALMFFAYAGMHDYVLYMDYNHIFLNGNESIWEDISNINGSVSSFTYFFLGVFPGHVVNWLYEVYHTFFVITGQIVAYFAMIFWLFLFLFTFFVIEKQEDYFYERRKYRQDILKKIKNINNLK